jgi:hypothetical protein
MNPPKKYKDPREYIEFMLKLFKPERYFYLGATILSLAALFYGFYILIGDSKNVKTALAMLAPTGLITMSCYRILKFWNDCLKMIRDFLNKPDNG